MLFKPEDLNYGDSIQEAANILNESVYLDESESILSPMAVPVVENARIGACVVAFDDVERLAEDHGVDYIDAMVGIAEANEIDMDHLAVSVPEWKIIADPEVVNELSNVVVSPISSDHPIYELCEMCVDAALLENDSEYIDAIVALITEGNLMDQEEDSSTGGSIYSAGGGAAIDQAKSYSKERRKKLYAKVAQIRKKGNKDSRNQNLNGTKYSTLRTSLRKKNIAARNKKYANDNAVEGGNNTSTNTTTGGTEATKETQSLLQKVKHYAWDTPKEAISNAISALKRQYQKLKEWAAKTDDQGKRGIFQKFIGLITGAIDKLTGLLSKKKDEEKSA